MPVGYPTNAFFYKGEWYNTDGEGMPATVVTNPLTGVIEISGRRVAGLAGSTTPILCIGGDHAYQQWYGDADNGMGRMYRDSGITPYLSINTSPGAPSPGDAGAMSWEQIRRIQDGGCEIMSHGHRHVHQWGRMDTGIRITYLGASATASVHISGSPKTLTLTAGPGEGAVIDLTAPATVTLGALSHAINSVASWQCTLASELSGTERAVSLLSLLAARSVKAGGKAEYFSAGGGIIMSYIGTAYKSAFVQISGSNTIEVYLDGVRRLNNSLTAAGYNTLADVVSKINSAGIAGLTADLCDDTGGVYESYTQGDELATEMAKTLFVPLMQKGGIIPDGAGKGNGARLSAGLPHSYLIYRQFAAAQDAASANGVALRNFAQSGNGLQQWHLSGQAQYDSYRMDPAGRRIFPGAHWAAVGPDYIRSHYALSSATTPKSSVIAALDAMGDSRGCIVDMLIHAIDPVSMPAQSIYSLPATDSLNTTSASDFIDILEHIKSMRDAGKIVVATPEQARRMRKFYGCPQNQIFNPLLRNDGSSILGSNSTTKIPGWQLGTNVANVVAASVQNGALVATTSSPANVPLLSQVLQLEPGSTYRIGARITVESLVTGSGVYLLLAPLTGRLPGQMATDSAPAQTSVWATGDQDVELVVSVPHAGVSAPQVRGAVSGPYTITTGVNDTLAVSIDGLSAVSVTLAAGTQSATQVSSAINAAIAASGTYAERQEYWTSARAESGKVVITSPYVPKEFWARMSVTGSATQTVFGGSICLSAPEYTTPSMSALPSVLTVMMQMQGVATVSAPYCTKVDLAH